MKFLEPLTLPNEPGLEQGNAIRFETLEELALNFAATSLAMQFQTS
jgi:hypothetical protein